MFEFQAPAVPPVQTSFGIMHHRPAVLLRVCDHEGAVGWGEVWCNFPAGGAAHRAALARHYLGPLVLGRSWEDPRDCWRSAVERLAVLARQTGEHGPFAQILAGLDVAIWDLLARRAQQPLWRLLRKAFTQGTSGVPGAPGVSADAAERVPVYASGINPTDPERLAMAMWDQGHRAFKLKVGFGQARDTRNLHALRAALGQATPLMVDANQAWTLEQALAMGPPLSAFHLGWLEEPLRADAPWAEWQALARQLTMPLAAGENLSSHAQFDACMHSRAVQVIQPDLGKWGGFSACVPVGQQAVALGHRFCPHWLGAGIGLAASLHLKAAVGGPGLVEVDANPNPLQSVLAMPAFTVQEGVVTLGEAPGLGVAPDFGLAGDFRVAITQ